MSRHLASRLAWLLWTLSTVLTLLGLVFLALSWEARAFLEPWGARGLPAVFALMFSNLGVLVASRRPENVLGWLFLVAAVGSGLQVLGEEYWTYAHLVRREASPGALMVAWISYWIWIPMVGLVGIFLLLFPNGQPPSPRWRWVAWVGALGTTLATAGLAFAPGEMDIAATPMNPVGIERARGMLTAAIVVGGALGLIGLFASGASLIFRFARAKGEERQQLKWIASTSSLVPLGLALVVADVGNKLYEAMMIAGVLLVPLSAGIAILRYRLYQIDLIINRTLVYGTLTVTLAGVYFGVVGLMQTFLRAVTGGAGQSDLAIVASTLAIAALFQPLRRRIQGFIDRRFYRRRYDAARTLSTFSGRLRDEVNLSNMSDELLGVVRETMQPAHVSLWIRPLEGRR